MLFWYSIIVVNVLLSSKNVMLNSNCLQGKGRKTAMWATNIGNEHGQVIMSVQTVARDWV